MKDSEYFEKNIKGFDTKAVQERKIVNGWKALCEAVYLQALKDVNGEKASGSITPALIKSAGEFLEENKEDSLYGRYLNLTDIELNKMLENYGVPKDSIMEFAKQSANKIELEFTKKRKWYKVMRKGKTEGLSDEEIRIKLKQNVNVYKKHLETFKRLGGEV